MDRDSFTPAVIGALRRDAGLHENGDFRKIGDDLERLEGELPGGFPQLAIAMTFWDEWVEAASHDFADSGEGLGRDDWPRLARHIADRLEGHGEITEHAVLANFDIRRDETPPITKIKQHFKHKG